jgi:hypothetical protein
MISSIIKLSESRSLPRMELNHEEHEENTIISALLLLRELRALLGDPSFPSRAKRYIVR